MSNIAKLKNMLEYIIKNDLSISSIRVRSGEDEIIIIFYYDLFVKGLTTSRAHINFNTNSIKSVSPFWIETSFDLTEEIALCIINNIKNDIYNTLKNNFRNKILYKYERSITSQTNCLMDRIIAGNV